MHPLHPSVYNSRILILKNSNIINKRFNIKLYDVFFGRQHQQNITDLMTKKFDMQVNVINKIMKFSVMKAQ